MSEVNVVADGCQHTVLACFRFESRLTATLSSVEASLRTACAWHLCMGEENRAEQGTQGRTGETSIRRHAPTYPAFCPPHPPALRWMREVAFAHHLPSPSHSSRLALLALPEPARSLLWVVHILSTTSTSSNLPPTPRRNSPDRRLSLTQTIPLTIIAIENSIIRKSTPDIYWPISSQTVFQPAGSDLHGS